MNTLTHDEAKRQKAGGAAALYIALALLAAMPYFLLAVDYMGARTAAEKVALIVANYASMYAMYLVTYVFYGIALSVLAFALYDRMKDRASATIRVATAIGLLWSFALVTSGMIFNYGMTTVAALNKTDPARAQATWPAIEPVAQALGGAGGEILGGLWILLVSVVALRSGALPKLLGRFGVVVGVAGLVSVVPPLRDASIIFGLMLIAWFVWIGTVLIEAKATTGIMERTRGGIVERPNSGVTS
ncbi:MAG TPA: DUF4386 family protein [Rectinemataceae bacterium]|nr:DUF4386 family protein [Rectinemataceae bacterium]